MKYDCIVIGASTSGLTGALKLALSGRKVLVLEKQPIPGGFATSFIRKGFTFESAIHCVDALLPQDDIRDFLDETGLSKEIGLIELPDFSRIIYPQHDFIADFDIAHFKDYLLKSFPAEAENIRAYFRSLDNFYRQFDAYCSSSLPEIVKNGIFPFLYPRLWEAANLTAGEFIGRFIRSRELKGILGDIWRYMGLAPDRLSAFYYFLVFRGFYYRPTCYVRGGFMQLFKAMVRRIESCGSQVRFNDAALSIVTDNNGRVSGVQTQKGEFFEAPVVISTVAAPETFSRLIDSEKLRLRCNAKISGWEKSLSAFQVYLGLSASAQSLGMSQAMYSVNETYDHAEDYRRTLEGDYEQRAFAIVDHARIDKTLLPSGKGSLLIMVMDHYSGWRDLDGQAYKDRKEKVADILIRRAERFLPGLSAAIEVREIATPKTMARYGSNEEGAIYGFAQTVKQSVFRRLPAKTEVGNLFLAGAWTFPGGGVHSCFISGLQAADLAQQALEKRRRNPK